MSIARRVDQQLAFASAQLAVATSDHITKLQALSIKQAIVLQLALALDLYANEISSQLSLETGALQKLLLLPPGFPDFRVSELQSLAERQASCVRTVLDLHQQVTEDIALADASIQPVTQTRTAVNTPLVKNTVLIASDSLLAKRDQIIASSNQPPVASPCWRDISFFALGEQVQKLKNMIARHRETNSEA